MNVSRRGFVSRIAGALGLTAAARFVGLELGDAFDGSIRFLPPDIKIRKVTGSIEITEEALAATQGNRAAFDQWANREIPNRFHELQELLNRTYREDVEPALRRDLARPSPVLELIDVGDELVTFTEYYGPGDRKPLEVHRFFEVPTSL